MTLRYNPLEKENMHYPRASCITGLLVAACWLGSVSAQTPGESPKPAPKDLSCPQTTNCVNSLSGSGLLPLRYAGDPAQGMALLRATLASYPEAKVVNSGPLSLEVIFTTTLGFKDQVDFVVDGQMGQIAYRSKSLVGTYDFGKNRSRMTDFTQRFAAGAR
jgi:uncharacterized protein (DUF1499 family)